MTQFRRYKFLLIIVIIFYGCGSNPHGSITPIDELPSIDPDYTDVTIPANIAPLNFKIKGSGSSYQARFSSAGTEIEVTGKKGIIRIPLKKWKKFITANKGSDFNIDVYTKDDKGKWSKFQSIKNRIAAEPVDPYVTYRKLYPGYESWNEISIIQRSLESFKEHSVIENSAVDQNCVNCHSFNNGKTDDFLFHMRGSHNGTYLYKDGGFKKVNPKTAEMKNGAVYPRWHPSGKFVAFSSNKIVQQFHSALNKKVEVSDLESSLVLYDVDRNEIRNVNLTDSEKFMDTYPEWSPDGGWLYFCRAPQVGEIFDYQQIRYDLFRVPFDPSTLRFGEAEIIFNASELKKSVSFPRVSPDGRSLVLTLSDYGCFPIWHKEADLWSIDLRTLKASPMALNSDMTDSYHSWSSNGRWLIFSSKRIDGLTARLFISHIDENGNAGKPFILPQRDPDLYVKMLKSFNVPEFSTLKIQVDPGSIRRTARAPAAQAKWAGN